MAGKKEKVINFYTFFSNFPGLFLLVFYLVFLFSNVTLIFPPSWLYWWSQKCHVFSRALYWHLKYRSEVLYPTVISKERHPYSEPWRLNGLNALTCPWLRRCRDACGSKPPCFRCCRWAGASLREASFATSRVWFYCTLFFCRVEHHATFWISCTFFKIKCSQCHLWPEAEKGRREMMSFSSLEGNLGTVVSCGCNYEYYSDYSVLWKW